MIAQRTLKKTIQVTGIGLHSGEKVKITLKPAPVNTGIVFKRTDLFPVIDIPANFEYVSDTRLCTTLQKGEAKIATVEHLLSALAGLGIDNVYVEVDGSELPIMDGSAKPFVILIQSVGIKMQASPKKILKIVDTVRIESGDKSVQFSPFNGYKVTCTIDFNHPVFRDKPNTFTFDFSKDLYAKELSRARTFGFLKEYEALRELNLAKGGGLNNAVVVDDYRVLNEDGLRFDSEFVSHKVLDAIGDLSMLSPCTVILGAFEGKKSGHELNIALLRELMRRQEAWTMVTDAFSKSNDTEECLAPWFSPSLL
jgi:UDP-3-O-[3-hydroxymyristoyl] N-acetylglucosamine deacetylase